MEKKDKLGSDSAFPYKTKSWAVEQHYGMSKRLLIAKDITCAILSNSYLIEKMAKANSSKDNLISNIVATGFDYADELLEQELL